MAAILVISPSHICSASLAIAANRAGEVGLLDLGYRSNADRMRVELDSLRRHCRNESTWGARWDALGIATRSVDALASALDGRKVPILLLAGLEGEEFDLGAAQRESRRFADRVYLEAVSLEEAVAAERAGFDGVVVKGFEAGGRIGLETTFCLLQRLSGALTIPYWVQGGIGPDTAASALLAGAGGVALTEQVWMASESPLPRAAREKLAGLTGAETVVLGDDRAQFRVFSESAWDEIQSAVAAGGDWRRLLADGLAARGRIYPVGQDVSFAAGLARAHVNVAGIVRAYRLRSQENFKMACRGEAFAPASPLAESHGTRHPIVQGPIAGITIEPSFCDLVESNGALPFLALGGLDADEARRRLEETRSRMAGRPWGAALGGPIGSPARSRCADLIAAIRPPYAMVDYRESELAQSLEKAGVRTYVHVSAPENFERLLGTSLRRFVFEGSETGGPVGPRSSFSLWQSVIDVLTNAKVADLESLHLIFAGPIHDSLSAAMTAAAAAPLSARGMKLGLQLGSAYFFTPESVAGGAVTEVFHRRVLGCRETAILAVAGGPSVRCVRTPIVDEFQGLQRELLHKSASAAEVREQLGRLLAERLVLAAKGRLAGRPADAEVQQRQGLYQVGEVVVLRDHPVSMEALHEGVSQESVVLLERLASQRLAWPAEERPVRRKSDDIAVVGMACMFPRAKDLREYWENICRGVDAIEEAPPDRWDASAYFDPDRLARDRVYSKWGGFLGKIVFDPMKWRIPPASLRSIEPIQLLSLEVAARAMADAGYDRREFPRERTGVIFACAGSHDLGSSYAFRTMMRHYLPKVDWLSADDREKLEQSLADVLPEWTEDSFPGFLLNVIAGRIARELNVNGPNYTVDAACAASMAAFHAAIEQLRSGTSDMMLVGGADATNNPFCFMSFAKTHALSPRGRSRPFDESGDGIALGEGIGVVVLKRLKDAERDGDKIYAVIKGIGSSSDGKNRSLTAPHPPGQIKAVERAYEDAGVSPETVSLVEAHGTGTVVGDSAEITTLNEVFSSRTSEKQFAAVGSVKSMIGHTKTVAGMASVIKTAMALKHRVLPPTIGVEKPTSRFDFRESPFYVNTQTRPWIPDLGDHPRRAGVSSFGFGGTNFHVVMEEYTGSFLDAADSNETPRSAELAAVARGSRGEVIETIERLSAQLSESPTEDLPSLCACICREYAGSEKDRPACRLAIAASSVADLKKKLVRAASLLRDRAEIVDPTGIFYSEGAAVRPDEVCFLYPGQGSQSLDMLRDLVTGFPWGQEIFARANRELGEFFPKPLSRYIYPPPTFSDEDRAAAFRELSDTRVAQPALGVVELFATELLARFGVRPGSAAGHSYGEHAALYAAGVLTAEELIWLSAMRGRVCADIAATSPGGMAAVQADAARTKALIDEAGLRVYLANMNAPDQTIIAGSEADVDAAVERISAKGVRAKRIPVTAPFHTPLLEAGSEAMAEHFAKASFQKPALPVYSNTTGGRHSDDPETIRRLLARHFSEPVHFEEEIRRIHADGARVFVECGPGKILTDLVGRILKDSPVAAIPIEAPGRDGWTQFAHAIARMFSLGLPASTAAWFAGRGLAEEGLDALLAREAAACQVKRSDWILGPTGATPANGESSAKKSSPAVRSAAPNGAHRPVASPIAAPTGDGDPAAAPVLAASAEVVNAPKDPPLAAVEGPGKTPVPGAAPAAGFIQQAEPARTIARTPGLERTQIRQSVRPVPRLVSPPMRKVRPPLRQLSRNAQTMNGQGHTPETHGTPHGGSPQPVSAELYMEFQASTRMFLEFQQSQQLLLERFLETQERLLLCCLGQTPSSPAPASATPSPAPPVLGNGPAVSAAPAARAPIAVPVSRPIATSPPSIPTAPAARPANAVPVAPAPKAVPSPLAPQPAPAGAPIKTAASAGVPAPAKELDGPPPLEDFRRDLLAVISERTGYPEDMLDVTLPLEAGLGIDSIKTVEIFSTLKQYHRFMREEGRDEEEALAEFTSLKTIQDILDSYARRIAEWKGGAAPGVNGASSNGVAKNGAVERHSLTAEPAPAGAGKKNSLTTT